MSNEQPTRAAAEGVLGLILVDSSRFAEGKALIAASREVLLEYGNTWDAAMCLLRLGYAAQLEGDLALAQRLGRQALDELPSQGDLWALHAARRLIAVSQLRQGDWDSALDSFEEALEISTRMGFASDEVAIREHLADLHRLRGLLAEALDELSACLDGAIQLGDAPTADRVRSVAAQIHRQRGDVAAARAVLEPAVARQHRGNAQDVPTCLMVQLGALSAASEQPTAAPRLLRRARDRARTEHDLDQEILALDALARALTALGRADDADEAQREADRLAAGRPAGLRPLTRVDRAPAPAVA